MKRLPRWPQRLNAYIAAAMGRPFSWGSHDCCTFADGAVEAVTGERVIPGVFGPYDTREGAIRALVEAGYHSLEEALDARFPRQAVRQARRGDIVAVPSPDSRWPALGVVTGQTVHVLGVDGVGVEMLPSALISWRVG